MNLRTLITALIMAALLLSGSSGRAQDAAMDRARELFKQGEIQYRLGNFKQALTHYKAALETSYKATEKITNRAAIIFNIAQCHRQLKEQLDQALFYYKLYLADWKSENPGKRPPNLALVKSYIAMLEAEKKNRVEEARRLKLKFEEERRARQAREQAQDQQRRLADAYKTSRTPAALAKPKSGYIKIVGLLVAKAQVIVDDVPRAVTPVTQPLMVPPGTRRVRVVAKDHLTWARNVDVPPSATISVLVSLKPQPSKNGWWLASSLTSLALAGGAEAMAIIYMQQADEHIRGLPPYEEDHKMMIVGHALAGAFGAFAVVSLVLYLRSDNVEESAIPSAAVVPVAGGAAAVGRFHF